MTKRAQIIHKLHDEAETTVADMAAEVRCSASYARTVLNASLKAGKAYRYRVGREFVYGSTLALEAPTPRSMAATSDEAKASITWADLAKGKVEWTPATLGGQTVKKLQALCALMNVAKGGTKAKVIARLVAVRQLRQDLSKVEAPEELRLKHSLLELRAMAAVSKSYRSGSKIQIATGLINWRDNCRKQGQANFKRAMALLKG